MILNLDCRHGLAMLPDNSADNTHPTVKPIALGRYLARLICPPGGMLLDLFAGSGSFGVAAKLEGFNFMGFELDSTHAAQANNRMGAF
jgi:site-specific DNA-methyltransferase (adenine-specific)